MALPLVLLVLLTAAAAERTEEELELFDVGHISQHRAAVQDPPNWWAAEKLPWDSANDTWCMSVKIAGDDRIFQRVVGEFVQDLTLENQDSDRERITLPGGGPVYQTPSGDIAVLGQPVVQANVKSVGFFDFDDQQEKENASPEYDSWFIYSLSEKDDTYVRQRHVAVKKNTQCVVIAEWQPLELARMFAATTNAARIAESFGVTAPASNVPGKEARSHLRDDPLVCPIVKLSNDKVRKGNMLEDHELFFIMNLELSVNGPFPGYVSIDHKMVLYWENREEVLGQGNRIKGNWVVVPMGAVAQVPEGGDSISGQIQWQGTTNKVICYLGKKWKDIPYMLSEATLKEKGPLRFWNTKHDQYLSHVNGEGWSLFKSSSEVVESEINDDAPEDIFDI
mmetsp:Transcript_49609/g.141848  ORF Transcript_49609/g.141848 Transcript_49609/m.141848 type:complete len:394 (+) Transcript_49609:74-1255(+)|eukprot:CAMPEP_0168364788 /NCGR_PEP_ID=MMETSP0228-20121227/4386_1 /TAXON_ID=133427 /ORGANISM="Protoceratium reticulatum, Strain CCCM 535 (=CCMP 1889)" /LENGTH=393 /DNA_ID=CAMNT_0008377555 /DNA_START=74 /DNA_END=1255 /DNA_ORIENTATION=-